MYNATAFLQLLLRLVIVHAVDCVSLICEILVGCLVHYLAQTHHPHCQPKTNKLGASQSINELGKSIFLNPVFLPLKFI